MHGPDPATDVPPFPGAVLFTLPDGRRSWIAGKQIRSIVEVGPEQVADPGFPFKDLDPNDVGAVLRFLDGDMLPLAPLPRPSKSLARSSVISATRLAELEPVVGELPRKRRKDKRKRRKDKRRKK